MTTIFLISLWRAVRGRRPQNYIVSGVILGLAMLTKTSLTYLALLYVIALGLTVWPRWQPRQLLAALAGLVLAAAIMSAWLAFNESHYGSLTADALAKRLQQPAANPRHIDYTLRLLPSRLLTLADVLPEEWEPAYVDVDSSGVELRATRSKQLLGGVLIALAAFALGLGWRRLGSERRYLWFALPTVLVTVELSAVFLFEQSDSVLPRFVYPTLAPLAIAIAVSLLSGPRGRRVTAAGAVTLSVAFVGVFAVEAHHGLGAKCCVTHAPAGGHRGSHVAANTRGDGRIPFADAQEP